MILRFSRTGILMVVRVIGDTSRERRITTHSNLFVTVSIKDWKGCGEENLLGKLVLLQSIN